MRILMFTSMFVHAMRLGCLCGFAAADRRKSKHVTSRSVQTNLLSLRHPHPLPFQKLLRRLLRVGEERSRRLVRHARRSRSPTAHSACVALCATVRSVRRSTVRKVDVCWQPRACLPSHSARNTATAGSRHRWRSTTLNWINDIPLRLPHP